MACNAPQMSHNLSYLNNPPSGSGILVQSLHTPAPRVQWYDLLIIAHPLLETEWLPLDAYSACPIGRINKLLLANLMVKAMRGQCMWRDLGDPMTGTSRKESCVDAIVITRNRNHAQ